MNLVKILIRNMIQGPSIRRLSASAIIGIRNMIAGVILLITLIAQKKKNRRKNASVFSATRQLLIVQCKLWHHINLLCAPKCNVSQVRIHAMPSDALYFVELHKRVIWQYTFRIHIRNEMKMIIFRAMVTNSLAVRYHYQLTLGS